MTTKQYEISTGEKQEFYTLWVTTTVDFRPLDENGEPYIPQNAPISRFGECMLYFTHCRFVQNLAKTREEAILKCRQLGIEISDDEFDFNLAHYSKPSVEAFGTKLQFKNGKWYAKATQEFFEAWRTNKDAMKKMGWYCSKYEGNEYLGIQPAWYMFYKPSIN